MEDSENHFMVERILEKRYNKKTKNTEYLVRWLGYTQEADTWEPSENILDTRLIDIFNLKVATKIKEEPDSDSYSSHHKRKSSEPQLSGFERGLVAENILGTTDMNGGRQFLIEFTDKLENPELVDVKEANLRCPQVVIKYYERHLVFNKLPSTNQH